MYDKVSPDLKFVEREQEVLSFWEQEDIFKKSIAQREGGWFLLFMTARRRPTASPISATCSPASSRTPCPATM